VLVSIVMAAYNAGDTIAEAVASVVAQTHGEWELIVVDDGSTDDTIANASSIGDRRIRILPGEHVGVLGQVRNRGLEAARGDAIALLDADDVWLPEKLERQVEVLRTRDAVGVVYTAAAMLIAGVRVRTATPPQGQTFARLLENNFIFSSSVLLRRSLVDRHGAFDPDPALGGSPDYELWLRLAPRTEFAFVDQALLLYRVHGGQMSSAERAMHRSALEALERAHARDPELVARHRASYRLGLGVHRCLAGETGRGRRDLLAVVCARPLRLSGWMWLFRALLPRHGRIR
jgi:glycosyltransferase involved in cell wall biosynthesis